MTAVWTLTLPPAEKLVLLRLADVADELGAHAYPSVQTLATAACISTRTVQRILQGLQARDLIAIEAKATRYKPTCYRLTLPPAAFSPLKRSMVRADILSSLSLERESPRGDTGVVSGVTQLCHPIRVQRSEEQEEQSAAADRPVQTVENRDRGGRPLASYRVLVKLAHAVIVRNLKPSDEMQAFKDLVADKRMRYAASGDLVAALASARVQAARHPKRATA